MRVNNSHLQYYGFSCAYHISSIRKGGHWVDYNYSYNLKNSYFCFTFYSLAHQINTRLGVTELKFPFD